MNFEKLKKFLKKNYKKIIVACLIFCLVSNKAYEKFTVSEALDGMKLTEKKVNDMYYSVDKDWNKSKKSIYSQKEIKAEGNVSANVDVIAKRNVSASGNVNAKKDVNASGNVNAKKFCIGKTCIDESHLQMLTDGFKLKMTANIGSKKKDGVNQYIHYHRSNKRFGTNNKEPSKLKMYRP
jgi:hypothetical protein